MSEENIVSFHRGMEAANRHDVEGILAELHPDVEWHAAFPMLGGDAVYRGHEVVRESLSEFWEALADTEFEFPEIRDVGNRVVGLGHFRGRGKGSGVEAETPFAYLVEYRGGKAVQVRAYLDPAAALEAAGLSE